MTKTLSHSIFVYGTLRFPQLMRAVTGRQPPSRPARLDGFARYRVRHEPCPGIIPCRGSAVDGWVFTGIDPGLVPIIDDYEGDLYVREHVTICLIESGNTTKAETYVIPPHWRNILTEEDWNPEGFARNWLRHYVRLARAWRREFET